MFGIARNACSIARKIKFKARPEAKAFGLSLNINVNMIYCKKCNGDQCYKQEEEKISWIHCPQCGYKERIKHYFSKEKLSKKK